MTARAPGSAPPGDLGFFDRLEDLVAASVPSILPLRPVTRWDGVVYRRHWFFLVRAVALPLLVMGLAALVVFGVLAPFVGPFVEEQPWWVKAGLWALAFSPLLWVVWRYENWRNDYYVVGSDRVLDVDKKPFGLGSTSRQASIGAIQNVSMNIPNPVASMLDFGDVLIETAGREGQLTFNEVHHPRQVMAELTARVESFRTERETKARERRQAEMLDLFRTYADVQAVTIQRNPPAVPVGQWFTVEWRVAAGAAVETWLEWSLEHPAGPALEGMTRVQGGGSGNYSARLTAGLGSRLTIQAVATMDDGEPSRSRAVSIVLEGLELTAPEMVEEGRSGEIRLRAPARFETVQVLVSGDPSFPDCQALPAVAEGDEWVAWVPVPAGGPVFARVVADLGGEPLESVLLRIDPVRVRYRQ